MRRGCGAQGDAEKVPLSQEQGKRRHHYEDAT